MFAVEVLGRAVRRARSAITSCHQWSRPSFHVDVLAGAPTTTTCSTVASSTATSALGLRRDGIAAP